MGQRQIGCNLTMLKDIGREREYATFMLRSRKADELRYACSVSKTKEKCLSRRSGSTSSTHHAPYAQAKKNMYIT